MPESRDVADLLGSSGAKFVADLVADPGQIPAVCVFEGFLGIGSEPDRARLYLTRDLSDYVEFPGSEIRSCTRLHGLEDEAVGIWLGPTARVTYAWSDVVLPEFNSRSSGEPAQQAAELHWRSHVAFAFEYPPPLPKGPRPSWREWIRKRYPVRPGDHRRHIVSYRYIKSYARWLSEEDLRELGYDPALFGGLDAARAAWIFDRFNDPANFWRGDGWWNSWLGHWMRLYEPFNWDFPSEEEARLEAERRAEEEESSAQEREDQEREERVRAERERQERERLERERLERERLERERVERERLERERLEQQRERERVEKERERLERERIQRERERRDRERQRLERERRERERRDW